MNDTDETTTDRIDRIIDVTIFLLFIVMALLVVKDATSSNSECKVFSDGLKRYEHATSTEDRHMRHLYQIHTNIYCN